MRDLFSILSLCIILCSCNNPKSPKIVYEKDGLVISVVEESNEFDNAILKSANYVYNRDSNEYSVKFEIENYELKANSKNNLSGICASSKDGQHIHMIVDNEPYSAIYLKEHSFKMDDSSHLALTFLSRAHHQSIKTQNAFQLKEIHAEGVKDKLDLNAPYLFYSRPKGTYVDDDAKSILLDFYLINTELSENGNKVKVEIDGDHTAILTKWNPYIITGLEMGDHRVKLSLIDKDENDVNAPFLPVERAFSLQKNP